jgi:hypothetical protein
MRTIDVTPEIQLHGEHNRYTVLVEDRPVGEIVARHDATGFATWHIAGESTRYLSRPGAAKALAHRHTHPNRYK